MQRLLLLGLWLGCQGCTIHTTATEWNGRVGPDGRPVYLKSVINLGVNLGIVLPVLGNTTMSEMVEAVTAGIAAENGDKVRIVESSSENYWFGFPPLTWILTPVITSVRAEYQPSEETLARDRGQAQIDR
jgi:hypothetical protein